MRKTALAIAATLALGGCATVPAPIAGDNFAVITPQQAAGQDASGQHVRWGGEIIKVEPRAEVTCFEVLSRDLWPDARPKRRDESGGRFMACSKGFYDPALYTHGRDLTITGTLNGTEKHKVGEYDYTFPLVDTDQVYLWPKRDYLDNYPYPYYGPTPYDPFWGGPYWGFWTPPPVIIVRGRHH
jgi:outer membrane lipoprotein